MLKDKVLKLVEESLAKRPWLFLLNLSVGHNNHIQIVLDGDMPVSVKDCVEISQEIEKELDRDSEDFSLDVGSVEATSPLTFPRQFKKNIGRKLSVKTKDNQYKADLISADEEEIELRWKTREPKPIGKGKHTVTKQVKLNYNEIEEAKVVIIFN
ncbi:MAG TPA: ribosome assembly cofactor RimP [Flavobacteriaceae bacterium]|nr:ribosome assembly cofactor RimP [Flavobacteriaceae bacterium]